MGLHYVSWLSTASGIEDYQIHADALSWVIGDSEAVDIEQTKSYHGSPIYLVKAEIKNKSRATKSLSRLGVSNLEKLIKEINDRTDSQNVIHIRLCLRKLLSGEIEVATPEDGLTVKGRAKIEVYPGNNPIDVAIKVLTEAINDAKKNTYTGKYLECV